MYYKRADGRNIKEHVNEMVHVVGTVEKMQDASTATILAGEPISAHIPGNVDVEVGEAYALIATCVDDTTINVKSAIHIPKEDFDEKVALGIVDASKKYSNFFYF